VRNLFSFVIKLALLVTLGVWLADQPGTARIVWHDYVIETPTAVLVLCTLAAGFVFYLLFRFWHLIRNGPELWRLGRKLRKMQQGQECLTQGLVAIAAVMRPKPVVLR